jgi:hypothetical protein
MKDCLPEEVIFLEGEDRVILEQNSRESAITV